MDESSNSSKRKVFWLGLMGPLVAIFAVMFSMIGGIMCETVQFNASGPWLGDTVDFAVMDIQLGPWSQKDTVLKGQTNLAGQTNYFVRDICVNHRTSQVDIDAKWKAVRAFSILTPIIGGILSFVIFLNNCIYYLSPSTWRNVMILFGIILPIFQGLSFLLLDSNACLVNPLLSANPSQDTISNDVWAEWIRAAYPDESCTWGVGMTMNLVSTVLFFVTACCMYFTGVPIRPPVEPPQTQEVTYQRTVGPDGTVIVTQTNVVKGTVAPTTTTADSTEQPVV